MADAPYDQTNIGLRERPSSGDLNQAQSQIYRTMREMARVILSPRASLTSPAMSSHTGFLSDGFMVVASSPAAMSVQVSAGLGYLLDATDTPTNIGATDLEQVNDLSPFKPLSLLAPVTFTVPAAPGAPNSRIDIIEVKNDRRLENPLTRRQLDPGTESFLDHVFNKTLAYALDGRTGVVSSPAASTAGLSYKVGTAANPGLVPATTAGYTKIAEILVGNATTSITGSNLVDRRALLFPGGMCNIHASWRWQFLGGAPTTVITTRKVITPPGIQVGLRQNSTNKADGILYIVGGEIAQAVVTPSIATLAPTGTPANEFLHTYMEATGLGDPVTVDGTLQTALSNATPPILVGIGTKAYVAQVRSRYQLNGATNVSGTPLEDVIYTIAAGLSW